MEARILRSITLAPDDPSAILTAPASGSARVAADQSFRLEIGGEGDPLGPVEITVSAPDGTRVASRQLTLAEAAKTRRPDLKTLFTSGYTEDSILRLGKLDPGVRLLSKPYRKHELATRVREALDG